MDESTVAKEIADIVLARAATEGAARIRRVEGWVASHGRLSAESMQLHFGVHTRGTPAEGARLDIRSVVVQARCKGCGETYPFEHHRTLCPHCGFDEADLSGETGVGVAKIE